MSLAHFGWVKPALFGGQSHFCHLFCISTSPPCQKYFGLPVAVALADDYCDFTHNHASSCSCPCLYRWKLKLLPSLVLLIHHGLLWAHLFAAQCELVDIQVSTEQALGHSRIYFRFTTHIEIILRLLLLLNPTNLVPIHIFIMNPNHNQMSQQSLHLGPS